MKIGIDIDDVITDTSSALLGCINKYGYFKKLQNDLVDIMKGDIKTKDAKEFIDKYYLEVFKNTKIKSDAKKVINELYENGNKIYIISSRSDEEYPGYEKATYEFIDKYKFKYTDIFLRVKYKAHKCKELGLNIFIDDSIKICERCNLDGVKAIVFNSIVNLDIYTKLDRVNNWKELNKLLKNYNESLN